MEKTGKYQIKNSFFGIHKIKIVFNLPSVLVDVIMKIKSFFKKQVVDLTTYGFAELKRKFYLLINYFIIMPFYIVAIPACFIIRLISPWIIVRTIRLPAGNFGDFIIFAGIYYCKKKLKIDQQAIPTHLL